MKLILVVSDTHGNKDLLKQLVKTVKPDYLFFLGDVLKDVADFIGKSNVYVVKGNWDVNWQVSTTEIVQIEGVRFFLCHGHTFGVKSSLSNLVENAKAVGADVVTYGHTHVACKNKIEDICFLNPGAFSHSKGGKNTYALIEVDNGSFKINMCNFLK